MSIHLKRVSFRSAAHRCCFFTVSTGDAKSATQQLRFLQRRGCEPGALRAPFDNLLTPLAWHREITIFATELGLVY